MEGDRDVDSQPQPNIEAALLRIQSAVDVGLANVDGSLRLLLQRADQTDTRLNEQSARTEKLDGRVHSIETADMVTRRDLNARSRQLVAVLALIVAAVGVAVTLILGLTR